MTSLLVWLYAATISLDIFAYFFTKLFRYDDEDIYPNHCGETVKYPRWAYIASLFPYIGVVIPIFIIGQTIFDYMTNLIATREDTTIIKFFNKKI